MAKRPRSKRGYIMRAVIAELCATGRDKTVTAAALSDRVGTSEDVVRVTIFKLRERGIVILCLHGLHRGYRLSWDRPLWETIRIEEKK